MNTCGQCKHARLVPGDLRQRLCMGGPPQGVAIPTQQGIQVQWLRPMVMADAEAPSCFVPAIVIELSADGFVKAP
jgi:hypothetical protein